jgi:hypothetical protein
LHSMTDNPWLIGGVTAAGSLFLAVFALWQSSTKVARSVIAGITVGTLGVTVFGTVQWQHAHGQCSTQLPSALFERPSRSVGTGRRVSFVIRSLTPSFEAGLKEPRRSLWLVAYDAALSRYFPKLAVQTRNGTWAADDVIVFSSNASAGRRVQMQLLAVDAVGNAALREDREGVIRPKSTTEASPPYRGLAHLPGCWSVVDSVELRLKSSA